MKNKILYGVIGLAAVITIAAYLSEKGVGESQKSLQGARQPGDQRVRDDSGAASQGSQGSGGRKMKAEGEDPAQGGGRAKGGGRKSAKQSGRNSERGQGSYGTIGSEVVPVFVSGAQKGEIAGQKMLDQLKPLTIVAHRGVRQGWGVTEALNLAGVSQGSKATFTGRKGQVVSLEWTKLTGKDPLYILSYTNGGQLVLISGQGVNMDDPAARQQKRGRKNTKGGETAGDKDSVSDIVKIEIS